MKKIRVFLKNKNGKRKKNEFFLFFEEKQGFGEKGLFLGKNWKLLGLRGVER